MPTVGSEELRAFFRAIESGEIRLVAEIEPQEIYAGNVSYRASNGWRVVVFNDANEFDYVDHLVADDGRSIDFEQLEGSHVAWHPDDDMAWRCLGLPGYCSFRCTTCGARLPSAVERGEPVLPPFVCGADRCIAAASPQGTWIRVAAPSGC